MRLWIRFILPLVAVLAFIGYATLPLVDRLTLSWFIRDLDARSRGLAVSMEQRVAELISEKRSTEVIPYFQQVLQNGRVHAIGFCDAKNDLAFKTIAFPESLQCQAAQARLAEADANPLVDGGMLHLAMHPIRFNNQDIGHLLLLHDMSFIAHRSAETRRYMFYLFLTLALLISSVTVFVAQMSFRDFLGRLRKLIRGGGLKKALRQMNRSDLAPLARDIRAMVREFELEQRTRDETQIQWTPQALKQVLNQHLAGDEILVVANRQPYSHLKQDGHIEVRAPASGLVTALEPVVRACSGTWIAHGSGTADRAVVDKRDHVRVPPENPSYDLRRIWLTKQQEQGYYYGFSNEGLWPLCHMAHTRPTFRLSDWRTYVEVNQKFADAVVHEAKTEDPVILVQDYHFALLPRMVRDKLPEATILTFWHIPWPNPESFGICPWYEEILNGLLGSSILGFHTRFHCNNFVDSVDRFLEARIDREMSTVSFGGKVTAVKAYPISIEWPLSPSKIKTPVSECRKKIRELNHLPMDRKIGMGVDRLDYTKGIVERLLWVDSLLAHHPEHIGKFSFIQIAAPSRSKIDQYKAFESQVRALASEINARHGFAGYEPIVLKIEHHEADQVFEYYRGSDICVVSSLHDGMNLVAKEFVASRDDDEGVLVLSQFTGAARELPEALVVNPYNIDQGAAALQIALTMPVTEQQTRMRSMRNLVRDFNVYRWAGRMLMDASHTRRRQRLMGRIQETENSLQQSFTL